VKNNSEYRYVMYIDGNTIFMMVDMSNYI